MRAQVSQEINDRLMDELSTFSNKIPLSELLAPHVRGRIEDARRVRALDISGKDRELLQAISDPRFTGNVMTQRREATDLAERARGIPGRQRGTD